MLKYLQELVDDKPNYIDAESLKKQWTEALITHLNKSISLTTEVESMPSS